MNPLIRAWIGTWLRGALLALAGYLRARDMVTPEQGQGLVDGLYSPLLEAVLVIVSLGWSMAQKYFARQKQVTAQAMAAGVTDHQVEQVIKDGLAPSAMLGKEAIPWLAPPA